MSATRSSGTSSSPVRDARSRRKTATIAAAVTVAIALLPTASAYASSENIVNGQTTNTGWTIYTTKRTTTTKVTFAPNEAYGGLIWQNAEDGYYLGLEAVPPGGPVIDPEHFAAHWWTEYDRRTLIESGDGSAYIFVMAAARSVLYKPIVVSAKALTPVGIADRTDGSVHTGLQQLRSKDDRCIVAASV